MFIIPPMFIPLFSMFSNALSIGCLFSVCTWPSLCSVFTRSSSVSAAFASLPCLCSIGVLWLISNPLLAFGLMMFACFIIFSSSALSFGWLFSACPVFSLWFVFTRSFSASVASASMFLLGMIVVLWLISNPILVLESSASAALIVSFVFSLIFVCFSLTRPVFPLYIIVLCRPLSSSSVIALSSLWAVGFASWILSNPLLAFGSCTMAVPSFSYTFASPAEGNGMAALTVGVFLSVFCFCLRSVFVFRLLSVVVMCFCVCGLVLLAVVLCGVVFFGSGVMSYVWFVM